MKIEEKKDRLEALKENEAFIGELKQAGSKEELQKTFAHYGIEMDRQEIDAFTANVERFLSNEEISENELEQVSGGVTPWAIFGAVFSWGKDIWVAAWGWGKKFANWEDGK